MSSDAYDLLNSGEQRGKNHPAGGEQKGRELLSSAPRSLAPSCAKPDPLEYGDPISYAEAENTYRQCNEEADAIELPR